MRWLLLVVIFSCAKDGVICKQCSGSADANTAESGNVDYIYNVYQFSDDLIQDWGETNRAKFFTRLELTTDGYPDTVHIAIAFGPDQNGEVSDARKETEKIRWVVRPIPITSLPGLYILPFFTAFPMIYHVYMSWDHSKRQVSKVMLVIDSTGREAESCTRTPDGQRDCQPRKGGMVFAEAERMPYDQAQARSMYLERKTLSAPAEQWTILEMVAFDQLIRLYQLIGSPDEDLKIPETTSVFGDSADEQLKKLIDYADKVVDTFSNTFKGVHATNCVPKELKPDGRYIQGSSC